MQINSTQFNTNRYNSSFKAKRIDTADFQQVVDMYKSGLTPSAISQSINIKEYQIYSILHKCGIKSHLQARQDDIIEAFKAGLTIKEIALACYSKVEYVKKVLDQHNYFVKDTQSGINEVQDELMRGIMNKLGISKSDISGSIKL